MNHQKNSRDFFFHLLLQYSAWGRTGSNPVTLLALRPRCRSSSRVAEQRSQKMLTCRGAVNKSRRQRWRTCCSTEGYGVTRTHRDTELPAAAALPRQCPEVTWDPLHRAECVPATVTAPRFKWLQWDVSHCKAVRTVLLCPVSSVSSKLRAFKHTALPTATETFSLRTVQ